VASAAEERLALALARGVCRFFDAAGCATLTEFTVRSGRRADVIALDDAGRFTIVEIKTSLADLRADAKWPEYLEFCDSYFFAVPEDFPLEALPEEHGLMIADRFEATVVRGAAGAPPMNASRRRAKTLRFAQLAARRLRLLLDPPV
jgi:hypothetical protein